MIIGHCRRRKIRCVLAEQDDHGRCQNCIRLKKECVFYPVDSAGGPESRAQQRSGAGSKSSSVISNSPSDRKPTLPGGESERDFGRFPPLASNAPSEHASLSSGGGLGISNAGCTYCSVYFRTSYLQSTASIPSSEFSFDSGVGTRDGWHSGMFQQADSTSDASTAGSWRVQGSPRMSGFPAYPSSDGQPGAVYSNYHYPPTRGEYGMQPPLRSMSYGNIEPSISFQQAAPTNSLEYTRQSSASHYTIPPTDASHTPTSSSVLDPSINSSASESMPQVGMYSPQWSYYQQNPQSVGIDYARHDSGLQWYQPGQIGHEIEDPSRQHYQQQQHWQQQQHHHHLMPPPGSGYKGHSPG